MLMSTMTYDQIFETILGICASLILFLSLWIVYILIQIEQSKAAFYSINIDDETVQTSLDLEVEEEDGTPGSPKQQSQTSSSASASASASEPNITKRHRSRRIRPTFTLVQMLSVASLNLLTYLLLVKSNAPMWLSGLGAFCVFGVFLRFQIGDEIRRQRWDRLTLLLSIFLFVASLLSLSVYAMKSLRNGEIYEGPARIVAYDAAQYNNSKHDPSTRTDLYVQWGKDWGCPLSGSKVCQAQVQGAMCQVNIDGNRKKRRFLADDVQEETREQEDGPSNNEDQEDGNNPESQQQGEQQEDTEFVEEENQELEEENSALEQQNEQLEAEIEELEQENAEEEQETEVEVEAVQEEAAAEEAEADAEVTEEEVYEYEDAEIYDEEVYDLEEEVLEDEAENTSNSEEAQEYEEEEQEYESLEDEIEEEFDEVVDELESQEQAYEASAEEHEEQEEELLDEEGELKDEEEELQDEEEELQDEEELKNEEDSNTNEETSTEKGYNEEEEEIVDEAGEDDWYWDEIVLEYDDDLFENEYWEYDWNSVWGEYACEDLFDNDRSGKTYDGNTPAGGDDDWPYINIYGSCKTCEAYILDYFAEEAFERVDNYKRQAVFYFSLSIGGFILSLMGFVKYSIAPPAENEIQLLESDGGVIA